MTHFHNPPRKWQPEELEILHRVMDSATAEQIGYLLPHRSLLSIKGRIKWERMDAEQHAKRLQRVKKKRKKEAEIFNNARGEYIDHSTGSRASPELIRARDERSKLQPRSMTAAFFGDPLPGYSALDRRNGQ